MKKKRVQGSTQKEGKKEKKQTTKQDNTKRSKKERPGKKKKQASGPPVIAAQTEGTSVQKRNHLETSRDVCININNGMECLQLYK